MGWTFTHKPHHQTAKEFLHDNFTDTNDKGTTWNILDDAFISNFNRSEYFAVVKRTDGETKEDVYFMLCCMVQFANDEYNIGWKDMTACMGPGIHRCPMKLLNLYNKLCPVAVNPEPDTSGAWDQQWRERVARYHAQRSLAKTVKNGSKVTFSPDHLSGQWVAEKLGRSMRFRQSGLRYKIQGWRDCVQEVHQTI